MLKSISTERLLSTLQTLLSVFTLAFIVFDIIVYRSAKSSVKLQQLQVDYKIFEYQNNLQTEYYEKIQKNINSTSKIRHDINNLVQVINIQLEENTDESRTKASELTNESEIKISDEIILDERTGIYNFDLCRIFVNLLDNAINALKKYNSIMTKNLITAVFLFF